MMFASTDSCKGYDFRSDGGEYHRHFQPVMETCENSHVTTELRKQPCGAQGCNWGQE